MKDKTEEMSELVAAAREAYAVMAGSNDPFDAERWSKAVIGLEWVLSFLPPSGAASEATKESHMENNKVVRVWQIGPDGTEYYAAHSEEEMKAYYRELVGSQDYVEDDLANNFEEVTEEALDAEFLFEGEKTTWRKLAASAKLPTQIGTGYN